MKRYLQYLYRLTFRQPDPPSQRRIRRVLYIDSILVRKRPSTLLLGVSTAIEVCGTMGDPEDAPSLQLERRATAHGALYLQAATGWKLSSITINGKAHDVAGKH